MLPDISFRYKIKDGINRRNYDDRMLIKMIKLDKSEFDGCTTPNAKGIVMALNEYLENSSETIFYLFTGIGFYKSISSGKYDDSEIPFLKFYADPLIKEHALRNEHYLWNLAKSMAKQRRIARSIKRVIKSNKVNKAWEEVIYEFIKGVSDRNNYVREVVVPEHIRFTPIYMFIKSLEAEGTTVRSYVNTINPMDEEIDVSQLSRDVALFIVENSDDDQASEWQDEMMAYVLSEINRDKINAEAAKKRRENEEAEIRERIVSDINSICGCVDKMAKERRRDRLKQLSDTVDAYVIVAARVSRSKEKTSIRYVRGYSRGRGYPLTKDFDKATIYASYDKALTALNDIRENPDIIAEIAYIDNSGGRFIVA